MYYISTSFSLSPVAQQFVLSQYANTFSTNFLHGEDTRQYDPNRQYMWANGIVGKEINEFLRKYDCKIDDEITFFMCNTVDTYIGNPHIDARPESELGSVDQYDHSSSTRIPTRFNIIILGNPADKMTWWNHLSFGDERLVPTKFNYISGENYIAKNIPGSSNQERWDYLGTPSHVAGNILTPSGFVKTDCAHTVVCSPVPRLILTVPLHKTIEELFIIHKNL